VSVAIHAQGALNRATSDWNVYPVSVSIEPYRVWDWHHPQFLAGVTFTPAPTPPVDLSILACAAPPGVPGAPVIVENHGGTVVLTWQPAPGPVAVYVMDVGSGPGLRDEPQREARDVFHPQVVAPPLPPAPSYLRLPAPNRSAARP